ncbi:MAG TPA: divalent metal cation transporter [Candidatus Aquilonibacter sp.]
MPWIPMREEVLRARDRARVQHARSTNRPMWLFALLAGPGILVMLGENDGPSMLSYATTGASFGVGFFIPFIVLTFVLAYIVQEMVVRIGIATRRGHAELIVDRFGTSWGRFAMGDLAIGNLLTLVTEFIAIRAGTAYFGVPPTIAVIGAAALVALAMFTRRYMTWERIVIALAVGNLLFIPAALLAHPDGAAIARALATWGPIPGGFSMAFFTLVLANIGATVTPWMLFFQQSAVVDKGLARADLTQARVDTGLGATIAAIVAIATIVAAATLYNHHVDVRTLSDGANFATALKPFIGSTGAALFALGMIEAGLVAAMTISTSSAYGVCEVLRAKHSLNAEFSSARTFYATGLLSVAIAGAIVLLPHAPLLSISITVNVIATLLMAPALLFVLLLASDGEIMGDLKNSVRSNAVAGTIVATIALVGAAYALTIVVPFFTGGSAG